MKILVVCQYYYPEPVRITDICEELVEMGHEVTVLTGVPNYPMGTIYEGYRGKAHREEKINGVNIIRCFTIGRRTGIFWRILNYFSYPLSSGMKVKKLDKDFDVVFVNQLSPVMMAHAAIKYKKRYHKKMVLYCLDLWPESMEVGGIKKGTILYKIFHLVSQKIYLQVDKLMVTSRMFDEYFYNEFGIPKNEIAYLPQYAEIFFENVEGKLKQEEGYHLMFAGNIGVAQSVNTIIEAAYILKEHKDIFFHIVGDGIALENCQKLVEKYKINSVKFYGRKPVNEMPEFYDMADAMLVTMIDNPTISKTLPGKVQTYMAAAKPIIGAINGETQYVIESAKCGYCGKAESPKELAENILKFVISDKKDEYAKNAREYYQKNFTKEKFMNKLASELCKQGMKNM